MNEITQEQAERLGYQLTELFNQSTDRTPEELARSVLALIEESLNDKHIVISVHTGFIKFRDTLNRKGTTIVKTTVENAIRETREALQIDESWSMEVID